MRQDDTDDDNDGQSDANELACGSDPLDAASTATDTDADNVPDCVDPDDDNDTVPDATDNCPLAVNADQLDTDGDGQGNVCDVDDDNDGVPDTADAFPLDATETVDSDGDGIGNNADLDDDNDGVLDANDAFPLDPSESADTDHDGIGDNADLDDDNDGQSDANELACGSDPLDAASLSVDTDGDGVANCVDADDDNDGVPDASDAFPLDPSESVDSDGDGIGDNADLDDDNDGVLDSNDAFPLDPTESVDSDGDGIGNNADLDDDNDGVADAADNCPVAANASQTDSDGDGLGDACDATYDNLAPTIGSITVPSDGLVALGGAVSTSVTFADANPIDTHTVLWTWGDGTSSAGSVDEATQSAAGTHTYALVGVYTVGVTVSDAHGGSDATTYEFVVVYDPSGGSVRGNGRIDSPAGACPVLCAGATGEASFGFAAKYRAGKNKPDGRTRFVFRAGDLTFVADKDLFEWLIVSGHRARFKGSGQINHAGDYGFMLTGLDGDLSPTAGDVDTFRIKIWDKATDEVVYDNQMGAADGADPATVLSRGDIKIVP